MPVPFYFAQWRAFQKEYAGQPYARFELVPDGYLRMTHIGPTQEALEGILTPVVLGEPIPLSRVVKVVPTQEEYEGRFQGLEAGAQELLLTDDHPAVYIDWFEAAAFAASVGGRLPTREEREYAARSGREGDVYGTDDGTLRADNAHWSAPGHSEKEGTARAKSHKPTPWGHYDLAGNVWEWVALKGALQGYCGGSWADNSPGSLLATDCDRLGPDDRYLSLGFRVARSVPKDSSS